VRVKSIARFAGHRCNHARGVRGRHFGAQRFEPAQCVSRRRGATGARRGGGRRIDQQHEFAARTVRVGREPVARFGERHPRYRLEFLRELARDHEIPRAAQRLRERGDRRADPMRRLVDHQRARQRGDGCNRVAARLRARRKKTQEQELRGQQPGGGERGDQGARTWNRHHAQAGVAHRASETRAGIADRGRTGIAHQRDAAALAQQADQLLGAGGLVVLVQGDRAGRDAEVAQQNRRDARVLGGDHVHASEDIERAQAHVAQVTERSGNHI
jgi:hypothetical protein